LYAGTQLPNGRDLESAYRARKTVCDRAKAANLYPRLWVDGLFDAGWYRKEDSEADGVDPAKKLRYLTEFASLARQAVELDPHHPYAWFWKYQAARVVTARVTAVVALKPQNQMAQVANILAESNRLYREAEKEMPAGLR